jgi:uncharacterized protein (TIRG00374 family)
MWLVLREVDLAQVSRALANADYGWVAFGALTILATYIARAFRWKSLLSPNPYPLSTLLAALLCGQAANLLLPLRTGDILRSMLLGRATGSSASRALGSVVAEKACDGLALTAFVFIVAFAVPLPEWFAGPARAVGVTAAVVLVGLGLLNAQQARMLKLIEHLAEHIPQRWRQPALDRIRRAWDGMNALRQRDLAGQALFWSAIIWLLGAVTNYAAMRAFGVDSGLAALFLLIVLMVGITLPPSIAALGIFEAISILALGAFGVAAEKALAIGLMLHALIIVSLMVATSLSLIRMMQTRSLSLDTVLPTDKATIPHD